MKLISFGMLLLLIVLTDFAYAQNRIIASSISTYEKFYNRSIRSDTSHFMYTGNRGSNFDPLFEIYGADSAYEAMPGGIEKRNYFDSNGAIVKYVYVARTGPTDDTVSVIYYSYDTLGRIISRTCMQPWQDSSLIGTQNLSYTYDGQGRLIKSEEDTWDYQKHIWKRDTVSIYSYNNNLRTEIIKFSWLNNVWDTVVKTRVTYIGNNPDSVIYENYSISPEWGSTVIETYHYNSNNDNDTFTQYEFHRTHGAKCRRRVYTYDSSHNVTSHTFQKFGSLYEFENQYRDRYIYDTKNLITTQAIEYWDPFHHEYIDDKIYILRRYYDTVATDTIATHITTLESDQSFSLFPNPASTVIDINLQLPKGNGLLRFAIYDQSGKVIRFWNEPYSDIYSNRIDISSLRNGMYIIYNMNTGWCKRFVISH